MKLILMTCWIKFLEVQRKQQCAVNEGEMLKISYSLVVMRMDQKSEGGRYVKLDLLCMSENSSLNSSLGVPKIYSLSWGNRNVLMKGMLTPLRGSLTPVI